VKNKKTIDEYIISNLLAAIFQNKFNNLIEQSYEIVYTYCQIYTNISHSFWQMAIEGFLKSNREDFSNKLLKIYPIRYTYSEILWKSVITYNLTLVPDKIFDVFNLFKDKYDERNLNSDDFKTFEYIFNIFIEEISNF
jgi:hypothetical protein